MGVSAIMWPSHSFIHFEHFLRAMKHGWNFSFQIISSGVLFSYMKCSQIPSNDSDDIYFENGLVQERSYKAKV